MEKEEVRDAPIVCVRAPKCKDAPRSDAKVISTWGLFIDPCT